MPGKTCDLKAPGIRRPRILFVGGEDVRMRIPLLLALQVRGFDVGAIGSEAGDDFAEAGIAYRRYDLHRWIGPLSDWQTVRQLRALFIEHKPDIIHAFDTKPGILAPGAAASAGVPVRMRTITGMGYVFSSRTLTSLLLRPAYRLLQRRASAVSSVTLFQNIDDRKYFCAHKMVGHEANALVPGSGVDFDALEYKCSSSEKLRSLKDRLDLDGSFIVTMVARVVRHKGVMEYLEAARTICRSSKNVRFLLIGPIASEGRQAVPRSVVEDYRDAVSYLGVRHDVPDILSISDLFVLPSYYREGVPRVLLEACGLGLPVITTDMPGCRDVVRHGYNGWLVPKCDAAALAATMRKVISMDRKQRQVFGMNGYSFVRERFSLSHVADAYAKIYFQQLEKINKSR